MNKRKTRAQLNGARSACSDLKPRAWRQHARGLRGPNARPEGKGNAGLPVEAAAETRKAQLVELWGLPLKRG